VWIIIAATLGILSCQQPHKTVSIKEESAKTLLVLTESLKSKQVVDYADLHHGALACVGCNVYHTRAAEAVYPFTVAFKITQDSSYLKAAIDLGNWLIRQQYPGGEWQETPEEWTGTTTDQLLMLLLAFKNIKEVLKTEEHALWIKSMRSAADFLVRKMSPDFASINYCATTAATLAMMHQYFPEDKYSLKARELARSTVAKMDKAGFICGEGDRSHGAKYGADVGYEIDMSLWGLGLYAGLTQDTLVDMMVRSSLANHLYFVYPNGAIDGSWGIRSNKWTTYGSATADGCQILFSLYATEDARYRTAAILNLEYLKGMIHNGLISYGPDYSQIFNKLPCIYPTFVRSKNLAMAIELGEQGAGELPPLPTQEPSWIKLFPTVDVALVRSENFMSTISAYGYKELKKRNKSKYMHRPNGGSICNLWVKDYGFLQLSNQTEYHRWEPMHFPEVEGVNCITPRIEFTNANGYFTNLYEYSGRMTVTEEMAPFRAVITTSGELCDHELYPGGVAYELKHEITDNTITKTVDLRYHDGDRDVQIIEPIVFRPDMRFNKKSDSEWLIETSQKKFYFKVLSQNADIIIPQNDLYISVFPSIRAVPICLQLKKNVDEFIQTVCYHIQLMN